MPCHRLEEFACGNPSEPSVKAGFREKLETKIRCTFVPAHVRIYVGGHRGEAKTNPRRVALFNKHQYSSTTEMDVLDSFLCPSQNDKMKGSHGQKTAVSSIWLSIDMIPLDTNGVV